MMGNFSNYFDYGALARELFMHDYQMGANNNVFRVIWPDLPLSSLWKSRVEDIIKVLSIM